MFRSAFADERNDIKGLAFQHADDRRDCATLIFQIFELNFHEPVVWHRISKRRMGKSKTKPGAVHAAKRMAALAANCSRICMKARTTKTLVATASGLFNAVAAMIAPCSVKAWGRYFIFCPRFKVTNCDLECSTASASSIVS